MGGRGNSGSRNEATVEEKFEYKMSEGLKPWSAAEDKRSDEMSKYVDKMVFRTGDEPQEFYEENVVEEISSITIPGDKNFREDEITLTKMNLIYTQNWDENDRRVKRGKAVTGSTYYTVQTSDGAINENQFAYKTKADAEHAMNLYLDEQKQWREYLSRRKK